MIYDSLLTTRGPEFLICDKYILLINYDPVLLPEMQMINDSS
jgi:hypothetical protein